MMNVCTVRQDILPRRINSKAAPKRFSPLGMPNSLPPVTLANRKDEPPEK